MALQQSVKPQHIEMVACALLRTVAPCKLGLHRYLRRLSTAPAEQVLFDISSTGVATITLNSPRNRNALNTAMMTALSSAFARTVAHDKARVVVVQAVGPAFCAGHDLKELSYQQKSNSRDGALAIFSQCSDLMQQISNLPVPVIAAVHAVATAAGCQLAASCDIVLASPSATFATPGVNIGLFCSTPAVALCRSVNAKKAAEMLFCGQPHSAEDMKAAGLVNEVVAGDLHVRAQEMAAGIASKPTAVIQLGKAAYRRQFGLPVPEAYSIASSAMCANLVDQYDAKEGIGAFIEKRHPNFK
jgi:enoyl-CoA hydratase/carnithine racemase